MISVDLSNVESIESSNHLYQWDKGQQLEIKGLGVSKAPEIHFGVNGSMLAIVVNSTLSGGIVYADIPNQILMSGKDLRVYVHIDGTTIKNILIPVFKRNMPENYVVDSSNVGWIEEFETEANEITTAKLTEIDRKGTQTLDSIPDDYTALQNEVTDLKSDLIESCYRVIVDGNMMTLPNAVNSDTGGIYISDTWVHTQYTDISKYKSLVITMPTFEIPHPVGMAFYDINYDYISGVRGSVTGIVNYAIIRIEIPSNAKYAVFSIRKENLNEFYVKADYLNETLNILFETTDLAKLAEWEYGTIDMSGSELDEDGFLRTKNFIEVKPNSTLNIFVGTNAVFIYEYDSNGKYIRHNESGYVKYTSDSTHNLFPITEKIRLCTRLEPIDKTSGIEICNNISVVGCGLKTQIVENIKSNNSSSINSFAMQMFEKIGVISDSISCGWALDKNGNPSRRNVGISWVQQMARKLGCTAYNLGASGVDPIEWFQPNYEFAEYCYKQYQTTEECELYIIGLGLNGGTLGGISDIKDDYTQNESTFYGQYARIIQMINAEHPNSIVMCLTEPTTAIKNYDIAVRNICASDKVNALLVDLESLYFDLFNTEEIKAQKQPDGLHYTPYGYSLLANATILALNDFISKNSDLFKYVGVATV